MPHLLRLLLAVLLLTALIGAPAAQAADPKTGEQIYRQQCASCHGAMGEGTKKHTTPLTGDHSTIELARIVDKTMPEDDPTLCAGADAAKVAAYIHETFYSPVAQARLKPARIELSRLTVRQYQNSISDLIASFRAEQKSDDRQGLHGEYFRSRQFKANERAIDRVDPQISFDFGTGTPGSEMTDEHEFSIRWEGSILAPETGDYEFLVRTDQAARLWINHPKEPLVDAWVKSGRDTDHRATIRLQGGRIYLAKLEFSKAKQGVRDDDKKPKPPSKPASISLWWKQPGRSEELVPARVLSPGKASEQYVLKTPFPPDDRSMGYERGSAVSKEWYDAVSEAAFDTAGYVAARLDELSGSRDGAKDRDQKLREFCGKFVERAFRRPLSPEERTLHVDRQFEDGADTIASVKRVVLLTLNSPRFLYREAVGDPKDSFNAAAKLSYTLWDSLPDKPLVDAATAGQLATPEQLRKQAERMMNDRRARSKLREFFIQWLQLNRITDLAKDPGRFPGFTEEIEADLRTSLELMVDNVVWSDKSDFRELLLADRLLLNGRLAGFYNVPMPMDAPFQWVEAEGAQAGILTHPYLLAGFAYTKDSSPIHRGVFISRSVLGRALRPPPEAVAPLAPDLHPSLSTRERVILQTKAEDCRSCHAMINPLGFALENYDAVGRYRTAERGRSINTAGEYHTRDGKTVKFNGVRELAEFLAASDEVHSSFVDQLFHFLVKQSIRAHGPEESSRLKKSFVESGYNLRKLTAEIAVRAAQ